MAKPTRIKHSGLGIYLNDKQADRVQTFGSSTALNPEELKEIGNVNIVEVIDGIPSVDITLDNNQYGSIKTMSQLANKNFDYGYPQVSPSGATGLDVYVSSGEYYINEMEYTYSAGDVIDYVAIETGLTAGHAVVSVISVSSAGAITHTEGTEFEYGVGETPNVPATPAGELKLSEVYVVKGMTDFTDDYMINLHDYDTLELLDYEYSNVDIVVPVKEVGDNTTADPIIRTMYMENCFCNRLDLSFNTDGLSTENFSMESDNKRWFLNAARTVVVDRQAGKGVGTLTYTFVRTPTQMVNLEYTLKCRVYDPTADVYSDMEENTDYTVAAGVATFIAGSAPPVGDTVIFRYCSNYNEDTSFSMLPNPKDPHPDPPGGVRQGQVEIFMTDDLSNFVLRIESATVTADLTREALNEIGHALPYDRPLTLPVPVTITVNTKASDLEEFARMIGEKTAFDADTIDEMDIDKFSKNLGLVIKVWREPDTKRDEVPISFQPVLKTVTIASVSVTDEGFDIGVDSDATQTFGLKADNMSIAACI